MGREFESRTETNVSCLAILGRADLLSKESLQTDPVSTIEVRQKRPDNLNRKLY